MKYYERLKGMRELHKKSQKEIADFLNMNQSAYSKYEVGRSMMGIDKYIELAKYYNVSLDYLAGIILIKKPLFLEDQLSKKQIELLEKYEANPDFQQAINKLLNIEGEKNEQ